MPGLAPEPRALESEQRALTFAERPPPLESFCHGRSQAPRSSNDATSHLTESSAPPNDTAFSGSGQVTGQRRETRGEGGTSWGAGFVTRVERHDDSVPQRKLDCHMARVRCNGMLGGLSEFCPVRPEIDMTSAL